MEVYFGGDCVTAKTFREVRMLASYHRLEVPDLGLSLSGNDEDLAKIANDLLSGNLSTEAIDVLKTINDIEENYQSTLISEFVEKGIATAKRSIDLIWKYNQFKQRGFEYFPEYKQLLLRTDTLVTFGEDGTASVRFIYTDVDEFNEWISKQAVFGSIHDHTLSEEDAELLEAAREVIPQQYNATLQTLALISQFSRSKQKALLAELERGNLRSNTIQKLREDLATREKAHERKKKYLSAAAEFNGAHIKDGTLLVGTNYYNAYILVEFREQSDIHQFLPSRKAHARCEVFLVRLGEIDAQEVIGRWMITGKMSRSKHVRVSKLHGEEILDFSEDLQNAAENIEEPFRSRLEEFLVFLKLSAYSKHPKTS